MRFAMENLNMETVYNCMYFPYLNYRFENAKKLAFSDGGYLIRKLPRIVCSFRILILSDNTPKYMRFGMKGTNTETVYNCRPFPYFNFY